MSSDPQDTLTLTLKTGDVGIVLRPDVAPLHVARIKELTRQGFYDGVAFHRVIPGFMAQTGDPTGTGSGGSKLANLKAEFSAEPHRRGTLSMARTADPNSANSQFFICLADALWLDRQYTVFGRVIAGMEHVDAIKKGAERGDGAIVGEPDRIVKMRVGEERA
jgi:peptidylprolyl isomerase